MLYRGGHLKIVEKKDHVFFSYDFFLSVDKRLEMKMLRALIDGGKMRINISLVALVFLIAGCSSMGGRNAASKKDDALKSCRDYSESSASFMTFTKTMNPKNILKFSIRHDAGCKVVNELYPYWVMNEEDGHCEDLNSREKKYFSPANIKYSDKQASFSLGVIDMMNEKQKEIAVDNKITVKLSGSNGNCSATANFSVKQKGSEAEAINVSNLHAEVKFLSIKKVFIKGMKVGNSPYNKSIDVSE